MKKILLAVFLVLFTMSCMEETWTVRTTPEGVTTVRHNDPMAELLFGVYIADLINPPKTHNNLLLSSYYYPLIIPPYRAYSGPNGLPTWKDVIYEQHVNNSMRDYEYRLEHNLDMKLWETKMEVQRLIDDLESAKRRAERAKEEAEEKEE